MPAVSLLIKPAGGACNMRCRYCFYRDEERYRTCGGGLMTPETLENVFSKTLPLAQGRCVVAFQGGEPTLAGLGFFQKAVGLEKKYSPRGVTVENALQTNGLLIDEAWADFLRAENFLVGVSLDGPKALNDANRADAEGRGTYSRVTRALRLLRARGVQVNVLAVLTHESCRSGAALYRFFLREGLEWQQYIPCLDRLDEPVGAHPWSLAEGDYGRFLKAQFDCWYADIVNGTPHYQRYFENLLAIACGRQAEACDMRGQCSPQLVVEADGSVYPCDFYALDGWRIGNFNTDTWEEIEKRRAETGFIASSVRRDAECASCEWFALCRGGCRRHRTNTSDPLAAEGRNRFCADFRAFFEYAWPRLGEVARWVMSKG